MSNKSYWIYLSSAIVLLILPVSEIARWIRVSGSVKGGQTERVAAYMAPIPEAFQDPFAHTLSLLGLCVAAVFLSYLVRNSKGMTKAISGIVFGIATLLSAWLVFSLM